MLRYLLIYLLLRPLIIISVIVSLLLCYTLPWHHFSLSNRNYLRYREEYAYLEHVYLDSLMLREENGKISRFSSEHEELLQEASHHPSANWRYQNQEFRREMGLCSATTDTSQIGGIRGNASNTPLCNSPKRFTVLMVTHNRKEYLRNILYFLRKDTQFDCSRDEFLLIDYLSADEQQIFLPIQLKQERYQIDGGKKLLEWKSSKQNTASSLPPSDLSVMQNSCVKLIRKHKRSWKHTDKIYHDYEHVKELPPISYHSQYPNEPSKEELPANHSKENQHVLFTEKPKYFIFQERRHNQLFSMWRAWFLALKFIHSTSNRIFYFDNCNRPTKYFYYTLFATEDRNFYFPNNERFFSQNYSLNKRQFLKFLFELPGHFLTDPRSFFGVDQIFPWYFASERVMPKFHHVPHETMSNYEKYYAHISVQWRALLWLNYYGTPERYYSEDWCLGPKLMVCWKNGALLRWLRLPVLYHIVDALLFFEWLILPFVLMFNYSQSTIVSIGVTVVGELLLLNLLYWSILTCFSYGTKSNNEMMESQCSGHVTNEKVKSE